MLPNKVYDVLKAICMRWLPATATLIFSIAQIWHLPYAEEIVGTITAFDTFLGVAIGISTKLYEDDKRIELERVRALNGQDK